MGIPLYRQHTPALYGVPQIIFCVLLCIFTNNIPVSVRIQVPKALVSIVKQSCLEASLLDAAASWLQHLGCSILAAASWLQPVVRIVDVSLFFFFLIAFVYTG